MAHQGGAYPGFCSMKRLGTVILLTGRDASEIPRMKLTGTQIYTWVESGTVRLSVFLKKTTQWPRPGLEPARLDPTAYDRCTKQKATAETALTTRSRKQLSTGLEQHNDMITTRSISTTNLLGFLVGDGLVGRTVGRVVIWAEGKMSICN